MRAYLTGKILECLEPPQYPETVEVWLNEVNDTDIPEEVPMFQETCCDHEGRLL